MTCTAFLNHPSAADRLRWTREQYPDAWPAIAAQLKTMRNVVAAESALIAEAINITERKET